MNDTTIKALMSFLPTGTGMTFQGIVQRFRQETEWQYSWTDAGDRVWVSLKEMEKAGQIVVQNLPNWPLTFAKIN